MLPCFLIGSSLSSSLEAPCAQELDEHIEAQKMRFSAFHRSGSEIRRERYGIGVRLRALP